MQYHSCKICSPVENHKYFCLLMYHTNVYSISFSKWVTVTQLKNSLQETFPWHVLKAGLPQLFPLGLLVVFSVYDSKPYPCQELTWGISCWEEKNQVHGNSQALFTLLKFNSSERMHSVTCNSVACSSPSLQTFLNESLNALNLLQFRFLSLVLSVTLVRTLASESHLGSSTSGQRWQSNTIDNLPRRDDFLVINGATVLGVLSCQNIWLIVNLELHHYFCA